MPDRRVSCAPALAVQRLLVSSLSAGVAELLPPLLLGSPLLGELGMAVAGWPGLVCAGTLVVYGIGPRLWRDDPLNLSILISGGKEINRDSLSKGD